MSWPINRTEFGPNRTPVLFGLSYQDEESIVPLAVDSVTGELMISGGGGGGGGTSSTFGATFPTTGTAIGATNGTDMEPLNVDTSGNLKTIIENTSIPVTGTFYQTTQPVSISTMPTTPVTGTFYQATQPVSLATNTPVIQTGSNDIGYTGSISNVVNVNQVTVSTTAVRLSTTSTVPSNGIIVGALSTNVDSIFIGGSGVTTANGVEILAGGSQSFTCNLDTLYIISASSTTDKVWYNIV